MVVKYLLALVNCCLVFRKITIGQTLGLEDKECLGKGSECVNHLLNQLVKELSIEVTKGSIGSRCHRAF